MAHTRTVALVQAGPPVVPSEDLAPGGDPDYMLSLARGLSVIRAFGGRASGTVAEIARNTGFSRAAVRRCLHTLCRLGYASQAEGHYHLTPAVLALGYAYLAGAPLTRIAQPVLERVSERLHESSSLAVLEGSEIVYVARAATRRILSISLSVGSRLPAGCTSMGRVMLAFADPDVRERYVAGATLQRHTTTTIVDRELLAAELQRIRAHGYAIVDQELEVGLRSLAVPVFGHDGRVVAAINVGVHVGRADRRALQRDFLPVLQEAAAEIANALGHAR
jgi:IclR family transcriptional regulator, pca regulon regulatory protein